MVAAFGQRQCTFQARRAAANDQDLVRRSCGLDIFRVPTLAPFFSHGRVLGTSNGYRKGVPGGAHVTTNALANLLHPPLLHFLWQKRIGNGRPGRANKIQHAALDLRHHHVRRCKPTDADYRLASDLFDERDVLFLVAGLTKA